MSCTSVHRCQHHHRLKERRSNDGKDGPLALRASLTSSLSLLTSCPHASLSIAPSIHTSSSPVLTFEDFQNEPSCLCLEHTSTTSSDLLNPRRVKLCGSLRLPGVHATIPLPNRCGDPTFCSIATPTVGGGANGPIQRGQLVGPADSFSTSLSV